MLAIPLLPTVSALAYGNLMLVALGLTVSISLIWPIRALGRPTVKQEFA